MGGFYRPRRYNNYPTCQTSWTFGNVGWSLYRRVLSNYSAYGLSSKIKKKKKRNYIKFDIFEKLDVSWELNAYRYDVRIFSMNTAEFKHELLKEETVWYLH